LLKEREFGEQMEGYDATIDRMEARIRSMRTLILDLLDLTRIESGKAHRNIGEVDLGVVAQNAIDTIRPYAIQRDIDIQLTCPARATILADTEEVEIIMNNLLSNAVKYNLPRGRVNIRISEGDDSTSLEVEDTGIGMTSEECGQLFGDFVRLKNPRSGGVGGSGLGLSIVKKILDLYDARIEVESEPEKGSTFRVDFYKDTSKSSKP